MREKVRDLVYLDTRRYMSLENLRVFYWGIFIIPLFMLVIGIVSINYNGINWKSLFPIASIAIWSLLYWIFVLTLQSKRTKKTFELRFLVNGISGLLISSLFWIFVASLTLSAGTPFLKFDFLLWILLFYLIFSFIYVFVIILCVHKGVFALIKEKSKTRTAIMISAFVGALLPSSGVIGMYLSRLFRSYASVSMQQSVFTILAVLMIFLPALAHIGFVQYCYCKRYGILWDENGDDTSSELERKAKKTKKFQKKSAKNGDKKMPVTLKIVIGIIGVPIAVFILLLFIGFLLS